MMDGIEKQEGVENNNEREEIFSKVVRAGKRTYFLDVKATRRNDYYLTITESKKRFNRDGRHYFEKHKIFLYKEDFDKFTENLQEVVDFIKAELEKRGPIEETEFNNSFETKDQEIKDQAAATPEEKKETVEEVVASEEYSSNVEFDDLEEKTE